jgi:adenylate cyclase
LITVLATTSNVADSNERSETGRAIPLFKTALQELPQIDSFYIGFENGAWLQVRRTSDLTDDQRDRLRAPKSADIVINLVRPTAGGELPMRRIFRIGRATRSMKSIYGITDTTPASAPGIGRP